MRAILLLLVLALGSSAEAKRVYVPSAKQKVTKPHAVKARKSKVKARKAPRPRRRTY